MATMIDTLKVARSFEQAGFATPQAEALTAALAEMNSIAREDLAMKSDLRVALAELRTELSTDLRVALAELKTEFKADHAQLRSDNVTTASASKWQILWSLFGSQIFLFAAFIVFNNFNKFFS